MYWTAFCWLALLVFFLMVEGSTVSLVSAWFAVGSLAALLASLFGGNITLQIVLFLAVSGILLAMLRPLVRRYVNPRITTTNVDSLIGTQGLVTGDIDNLEGIGQVKLGGMTWTARSATGEKIPAGTQIRVERIEGVKAFVSPVAVKSVI